MLFEADQRMDSSESESDEIEWTNVVANDSGYEISGWLIDNEFLLASCIVHSVIFAFGLIGNILVVYSVLRNKSKQTVNNMFMSSLAVANILLCLFVVQIKNVYWIAKNWPFGPFTCHLWPCIYYSACYGSMLILASIAVNRYSATDYQLRKKTKTRKMMIMWLISIVASLPFGFFYTYHENRDLYHVQHMACFPQWPSETSYTVYFATTFVTFLLIPLIVIAYIYVPMSFKMSHMSTCNCPSPMADERRTTRLLIAMTVVFCICWMPYHIFQLVIISFWDNHYWEHLVIAGRVFHAMAQSSTCFTPLFYVWLNKITIKQFCLVGPCFKRLSHQASTVDTKVPPYTVFKNEGRAEVTYTARLDSVSIHSDVREERSHSSNSLTGLISLEY